MFKNFARYVFVFFILISHAVAAMPTSNSARVEAVTLHLSSDAVRVAPHMPFDVHLTATMDDGWHIYWKNPGDTGYPLTLTWDLPHGFTTSDIQWPTPSFLPTPPVMSYVYGDTVRLTTTVTPSKDLSLDSPLTLRTHVNFLMCKDICLPGEADLSLTLPVGTSPAFTSRLPQEMRFPHPLDLPPSLSTKADTYQLTFPFTLEDVVRFIPDADGWIDDAADQQMNGHTLTLVQDTWSDTAPTHLSGLLLKKDGSALRLPPTPLASTAVAVPPSSSVEPPSLSLTLGAALFFAFLAGLILNLMPCVLPVLALKVMSLLKQAHGRPTRLALSYTLGTLTSFWILAGTVWLLRLGGTHIGWGFQLQSPPFVGFLAVVMGLVTLSFYDLLPLPSFFSRAEHALSQKATLASAFLSGTLVTLIATPCTVPFMGAATAFALGSSAPTMLAIFTAMGLGLALPFLLLSLSPTLMHRLPRPGQWMITFKFFLGIPVLAATFWLLWLLYRLLDVHALAFEISGIVLTIFILFKAIRPLPAGKSKSLLIILLGMSLVLFSAQFKPEDPSLHTLQWRPWSSEAVAQHRAAEEIVLLDVTADWCLTCKVIEKTLFASSDFHDLVRAENLHLLRADWTQQNPHITELLEHYNRQGVPLYVIIRPQGDDIVLPQFPVLKDIEQALASDTPPTDLIQK